MESNPDFAQLLNNPQVLQESLQMAANPVRTAGKVALAHVQPLSRPAAPIHPCGCLQALLREQMRNADRAMSNIEAHPEGFNALRRMYETLQVCAQSFCARCERALQQTCNGYVLLARSRC